jgi:hypothetical protein
LVSVPDGPLYQLAFPQKDMPPQLYQQMAQLTQQNAQRSQIQSLASTLRKQLNPQPSGQLEMNVPLDSNGNRLNAL